MKNETFTFGSEPFNEWLAKHPDVEKLTIEGSICTNNLGDIDEQLFNSSIKTLEIGNVILKNTENETVSLKDYASSFWEDSYLLPRLFKIQANTQHSSTYSLSENQILSIDGKVLVHIEDTEILRIPEGVRIIGDYTCAYYDLEDVYFPYGLEEIGLSAFDHCYQLKLVYLPNSIEKLGEKAFSDCSISNLYLSTNLKEISPECFTYNELTSIHLPFSLKAIRHGSFCGNPISKVSFNQNLETIEKNAFDHLCYAKFPASTKEIAVDFYYEEGDTPEENVPYIEVDEANPYFEANNGNLYQKGSNELHLKTAFRCRTKHYKEIPQLVIPANLQSKSVILKWNPSFSSYPMSGFIHLIYGFAKKDYYECGDHMNWSVWDYDKINVGDRVYWVKVGYGQIGIVGSGTVTSEPYISEDWSGKGRITYYVDFIPNVLLNPDTVPILTCEELQRAIPDFEWSKGHSGLVLNDDQAQNLDTLWKDFLLRNEAIFKEKMQKEYNEQVYIKKYSDDERKTDI